MYESFFGFTDKPFSLLPDPNLFYPSQIHQDALTLLEYGLYNQAGFTVITGEIGAGKTTLMRYLLDRLEQDMTVGLISHTHQSLGRIMDWICAAFDIQAPRDDRIAQHQAFVDFLLAEYARGRKTLLIIDEAQNLDRDTLEEIRLLSNVNSEHDILLQLLLLGQPELREQLCQPGLEQFSQRISASYHLGRLSREDCCRYIRHRLRTVGGRPDIFTPEACHAVFHYSRGIPRLINLICDTALVFAYGAGERTIDGRSIDSFVRSDGSHLLFAIDGEQIEPLPEYQPILAEELAEELRGVAARPTSEPAETVLPATRIATERADEAFGSVQKPVAAAQGADVADDNIAHRLHTPTATPDSGSRPAGFDDLDWSAHESAPEFESESEHSRQGPPWKIAAMFAGVLIGIGLTAWIIYGAGPDRDRPEPPYPLADDPSESAVFQAQEPAELADSPPIVPVPGTEPAEAPTAVDRGAPSDPDAPETPPFDVLVRLAQEPSGSGAVGVLAEDAQEDTDADPVAATTSVETTTEIDAVDDLTPMAALADDDRLSRLAARLAELSIPVERLATDRLRADLSERIRFRDGSVALDEPARALLSKFAELLKDEEDIRLHIVTHTDSQGATANNQVLSERRAADISLIIRLAGIAGSRVSHEGKGMSEPKFSPEEERRLGPWINRRVEIDLIETNADG